MPKNTKAFEGTSDSAAKVRTSYDGVAQPRRRGARGRATVEPMRVANEEELEQWLSV